MPPRRDKAEGSAPRKRALVSCDRCKLRRARCIRDNSDEPCADCRLAGVQCESKLPRKQRVYGSVETLSLRYRALESLVKGLFPQENVQDTNVVFAIALARNISMPDSDDFTPADIFHNSAQRPLPTQPTCIQEPLQSTLPVQQSRASHLAIDQSVRSTSTSSRASTSNTGQHNPFSKVQPTSRQAEELIQTRHGVPHYFGPSSSFRLAMTVRTLSARCKATQNTKSPRHHETDSGCSDAAGRLPIALRDTSTNPSDEEYTMPDQQRSRSPVRAQKERSRSKAGTTKDSWGDTDHISKSETFADFLPSRSLADALVSAYFDHVHMFLPLFHRSIFQYQLEATYKRQSELLKDCKDTGWLICLALVFAFGCEQLQEHDPDQAHALCLKYLGVTKTYFCKLVTTTSLVSIQALLLLNLHYQARGQKSTSWLLVGLAARMVGHRSGTWLPPANTCCRPSRWACTEAARIASLTQ
jgi:proline utilization trans-activator